ncbi:MAG: hemolysin-type calcium-binding region protein [Phycisphaerales bacterium]|nr:hemolysin-type calcium-binding region protein [Phycisphaerales bacterium]
MIDALESRRLFSATLAAARFDAATGKIILTGSANADIIQVAILSRTQAQVIDGGDVVLTFNLADTKVVSFAGNDGADYISMGRTPLRLYADGGDGADAISGSRSGLFDDTLLGGSANDYLFGGTGNDTLDGGGGADNLLGNDGNDTLRVLSDNTGDDSVLGGNGTDAVDCTNYNRGVTLSIGDASPGPLAVDDRIYGQVEIVLGTGFDDIISNVSGKPLTVYLGKGIDTYQGGRGMETVYGGRGNDTIRTAGGIDEIIDTEGTNDLNSGSDDDFVNDVSEFPPF